MNTNEFQSGRAINLPASVIRSVSFDKINKGSPLTQLNSPSVPQPTEKATLYASILGKKLNLIASTSKVQETSIEKPNIFERYRHKINPAKLESMRREADVKELKECTFQPQTNPGAAGEKRTVDSFVKDQLEYRKKNNDKVEQMRAIITAQMSKENTFKPNVGLRNSKPQANPHAVHDRLYQDFKSKQSEEALSRQSSKEILRLDSLRKPKGTSVGPCTQRDRLKSVESGFTTQRCPTDAKHKKEVPFSAISAQLDSKRQIDCGMHVRRSQHQTTPEQEQASALLREMRVLAGCLSIHREASYSQMAEFLSKMNVTNSRLGNKHLDQIWQMVQGQTHKVVELVSLFKIVFAIAGIHTQSIVNRLLQGIDIPQKRTLVLAEADSRQIERELGCRVARRAVKVQKGSPLVYLNVVMEGREDVRVPVFERDTMAKIAEKVRVLLDLSPSQQLEEILSEQIVPALKQIGLGSLVQSNKIR